MDLIIDGGSLSEMPTTVVDLTHDEPQIVRQGAGSTDAFIY